VLIALAAQVKAPGEAMAGEATELVARYLSADAILPYERLLGDAVEGDPTLFTREDAVEAAWAVVEPVLNPDDPPQSYAPGTWGPAEAARLAPPGGWEPISGERREPARPAV
jgi:glucose-6-phosphate 1-dehydrogenase